MNVSIKNLKELQEFAHSFLRKLKPHESKATVVALSGDLGSGKTAFVKMVAEYFGMEEEVTSPTFVILKRYTLHVTRYMSMIHIDAYRLKNGEELLRLRFGELLDNPKNIIFIEWPENVKDAIPTDAIILRFTFIDETTREIDFNGKI